MTREISTDDTVAADKTPDGPFRAAPQLLAGRYELLGMVGSGGMGSVYRARDRELDDLVALKMLHAEIGDSPVALERFRRELKLARRVTHPNVARAFDIGEHEGQRFLTMELVTGESLGELVARRSRLTIAEVIAIASAIGEGMSAAHDAGVVHRDLKPDNVLMGQNGRVVVTDFGVARGHVGASAGGTAGHVVGTPAYMAPEQVEARPDVDHRADLYALGEIMYEMLVGERAWPGESAYAVAAARLVQAPPDPRVSRADVPDALAAIVLRCLARERAARFASAREVVTELAALAPGVPSTATTGEAALPAAPLHERTVAVLPFANQGDESDAYVADGLTEDLVDALSTTSGVRVLARSITLKAGDDARAAGQRLGVDVVVEGSVRRAGERLRIRARLVGVADGFQIWGERFDRPVTDALVVSDEVVRAIAAALSATVGPTRRAPMTDPRAVELYLRARQLGGPDGDQDAAHAAYEAALALAPRDPSILAAYAGALSQAIYRGGPEALPRLARAFELAKRAVAVAPGLPDVWLALAHVKSTSDPAGALADVRRAIVLSPGYAEATGLAGRLLLEVGSIDEAAALIERSLRADRSDTSKLPDLMRAYALQRRWSETVRVFSLTAPPRPALTMLMLVRTSVWHGELLTELPDEVARDPRLRAATDLFAETLRKRNLDPAARAQLEFFASAVPTGTRASWVILQAMVELETFSGHFDAAEDPLARLVAQGFFDVNWMDQCCLLAPLRARATFAPLRATVAERAHAVLAGWTG